MFFPSAAEPPPNEARILTTDCSDYPDRGWFIRAIRVIRGGWIARDLPSSSQAARILTYCSTEGTKGPNLFFLQEQAEEAGVGPNGFLQEETERTERGSWAFRSLARYVSRRSLGVGGSATRRFRPVGRVVPNAPIPTGSARFPSHLAFISVH